MREIYVIIPALDPKEDFLAYARETVRTLGAKLVVVDDGSGEESGEIFERISGDGTGIVLRHSHNRGKGRALKTGFAYVREHGSREALILCADCDGQHAVKDLLRVAETVGQHPDCLVLGARDFKEAGIPFRSRFGNRCTSTVFWLLCGKWFPDTQTGLRGFHFRLLGKLTEIPGERFEYEMHMLLTAVRKGIPVRNVPVDTIYEGENEGSHFRPFWDSLRILGVLFAGIWQFALSSVGCAILDVVLFHLFLKWIPDRGALPVLSLFGRITWATGAARILSAGANYVLNREYVFPGKRRKGSMGRYALLCVGIALASAVSVTTVVRLLPMAPSAAKILCDGVLFFISYKLQKDWVFTEKE